jgi:hypothetical protein
MAETTGPAVDVTEFALEVHVHVMETQMSITMTMQVVLNGNN